MKRITFIVNPVSGGKDKRKVLAAIDRYLDRSAFSYEVRETGKAGDATAWARSCDADIVVAVGGDGTVSEVATGLLGTGKALGIIPCGSGDGLALHLGISRNPAKAVRALNAGRIARIDAARLDGRPFFCTAGVGLDADVAWDFARSPKRGLGTYISTAWGLWKHGDRAHQYRVTTDAVVRAGGDHHRGQCEPMGKRGPDRAEGLPAGRLAGRDGRRAVLHLGDSVPGRAADDRQGRCKPPRAVFPEYAGNNKPGPSGPGSL